MLDIAQLRVGEKVHYVSHPNAPVENGIIKEIPHHSLTEVRVVYQCAGAWEKYQDFTSALTNIRDLRLGWET